LHTENVSDDDKIRAAVIAQLAKPAVEQSAAALLTKEFKYEVLMWCGIVGGALTLFSNLSGVLKLADWARFLAENWKGWTHALWVWLFGWLGIDLAPDLTPVLSFLLFWSLLTIGQVITFRRTIKGAKINTMHHDRSFTLISWRMVLWLVLTPIIYFIWVLLIPSAFFVSWLPTPASASAALWIYSPLVITVMIFTRHKLYAVLISVLVASFWAIISLS
jgi:hypothetical protein